MAKGARNPRSRTRKSIGCSMASRVRIEPWADGPALPRGKRAIDAKNGPLCGLLQYLGRTLGDHVADRHRWPLRLAIDGRVPASAPIRLTHPVRAPIRLPHGSGEALPIYQPHGPREECGVVGIWAPGEPVARLAYVGLHALQHRGQESAGIAVTDGGQLSLHKRIGLVSSVFDEETLARLEGR